MKTLLFLTAITFFAYSCRKDKIECPPPTEKPCIGGDYELHSTNNFDYIKQTMPSYSTTPTAYFTWLGKYKYNFPVFNPKNAYEFIYTRSDTNVYDYNAELFKFSFCTGKNVKLAANFKALDWGDNSWILGRNDYFESSRLKDNGDSLQQILTSANGVVGKWNPSCTFFYIISGQDLKIMKPDHTLYKTISIEAFDWLNDSTLLFQMTDKSLNSYNIISENSTVINSALNSFGEEKLYVEGNNTVYIIEDKLSTKGYGDMLRCTIDGSNQVDTITKVYPSFYFRGCNSAGDKIIATLVRQHWKDSLQDSRYIRNNILIMDLDGTNQRLVNLP